MATNRDPLLDPDQISKREFATGFRGYDPSEVRRFLQQVADASRGESRGPAEDPAVIQALVTERDELRGRVGKLERAAAKPVEDDDATYVTSLITNETTQLIEHARSVADEIIRKAESEASRRRKEVKELEQRVDGEIQQKRQTVAEDTAKVRRETQSEVNKMRSEADEETKSLRAKADEYASTTRAQAQEILRSRTAEAESFYETRTRKTEETTAAMRAEAEEETTTMRRNAEDASATMRREAEEETLALRRRTDEEAKALRAAAEDEAEDLRTAAQARVDELTVEADKIQAESETSANIARAEATAAADLATREVRDEARMMVAEARAVREKILTDLVRRRRAARQQIDQARAARDRLLRSLEERKRELDEATAELNRAVPEARAAMDRVTAPVADDDSEVAAALASLDKARPERGRSFDALGDEPETDAYADRLAGGEGRGSSEPEPAPEADSVDAQHDMVEEAVQHVSATPVQAPEEESAFDDSVYDTAQHDTAQQDTAQHEGEPRAGAEEQMPPPPALSDAITSDRGSSPFEDADVADQADDSAGHDDLSVTGDADGGVFETVVADGDYVDEQGEVPEALRGEANYAEDLPEGASADVADHDNQTGAVFAADATDFGDDPVEVDTERTRLFDTAIGNVEDPAQSRSAGLFGLGGPAQAVAATAAVGTAPLFGSRAEKSDSDEGESDSDESASEHAALSADRSEALDRIAPDLKRQLKRALADDQSDLLDAVRRGGKDASVEDLPAKERQVARFADALESSLRSSANAGASAVGGRIWPGLVDGLVAETASQLVTDVRSVVTDAVTANGGQDTALEAIRGHYRNVRTNHLGRLVDAALATSYDLGVEHGSEGN